MYGNENGITKFILQKSEKYFVEWYYLNYLSGMAKEKVSQKTGKKVLQLKCVKINPDAILEIKKQVKKNLFPSENSAINTAVEEKFLSK